MINAAILMNPPGRGRSKSRRPARRHKIGCACVVCSHRRKKFSSRKRTIRRKGSSGASGARRGRPVSRRIKRSVVMAKRSGGKNRRRRYAANKRGWFKRKGKYRGSVTRKVGKRRRRRVYTHPKRSTVKARRRAARRYAANPGRARRSRRRFYGRTHRMSSNPVATLTSTFKDILSLDTIQTVVAGLVGFGGSLALPQVSLARFDLYRNPVVRVGSSLVATGLLSALVGMITKSSAMAKTVLVGGLVGTGWRALSEVVPQDMKATFPVPLLSGMGDASSDAFKSAIEREIIAQLQQEGVSAYLTPSAAIQAEQRAGIGAYLTPAALERAGMNGLGADEFDTRALAERF